MPKGLKPCPVCGRKANVILHLNENNDIKYCYVECSYCPIRSKDSFDKQKAIRIWNNLPNVKKERDWLADQIGDSFACYPPSGAYCDKHSCDGCKYTSKDTWLKAAKRATQ